MATTKLPIGTGPWPVQTPELCLGIVWETVNQPWSKLCQRMFFSRINYWVSVRFWLPLVHWYRYNQQEWNNDWSLHAFISFPFMTQGNQITAFYALEISAHQNYLNTTLLDNSVEPYRYIYAFTYLYVDTAIFIYIYIFITKILEGPFNVTLGRLSLLEARKIYNIGADPLYIFIWRWPLLKIGSRTWWTFNFTPCNNTGV